MNPTYHSSTHRCNASTRTRTRTHVTLACTNCRRLRRKCSGKSTCLNCADQNLECEFVKPEIRRGRKPKRSFNANEPKHALDVGVVYTSVESQPQPPFAYPSNSTMTDNNDIFIIPQYSQPHNQNIQGYLDVNLSTADDQQTLSTPLQLGVNEINTINNEY
ncbi:6497_t:CDS:1, partial [Acaulospora colombiana]